MDFAASNNQALSRRCLLFLHVPWICGLISGCNSLSWARAVRGFLGIVVHTVPAIVPVDADPERLLRARWAQRGGRQSGSEPAWRAALYAHRLSTRGSCDL